MGLVVYACRVGSGSGGWRGLARGEVLVQASAMGMAGSGSGRGVGSDVREGDGGVGQAGGVDGAGGAD